MKRLAACLAGTLGCVFLFLGLAGERPAEAAESCPALPNAESTFGGALTSLINKATGGGSRLSTTGDPVKLLNDSQQQKVLGWLRTELDGRQAALAADREKSAAEKKVEELQRRIFTRDRMERDAAVVGNRVYDQVGGEVLPSSRQGKPLGQILDEEIARGKPGLVSKYGDKYKNAIFDAVKADPAKAGEFAGALSAGDYSTVMDQAADWGAAGFGATVGDALEEMGYENSKAVWTKAVKHAGVAKDVMIALKDGNHDAAWEVIKDEWKKEVKDQSRAALKAAVNLAFNAGNGAGSIGDFVPLSGNVQNALAPDFFGLTPGDIYLKVLDAEVAFIKWSEDFLRRKWSQGDGACIREYNEEYQRLGNANDAYEAFDHCNSTSRFSGMFKFTAQARELGVDPTAAVKEYLEAQRRGLPNTWTPAEWMAAKMTAQREALERQMGPELTRTEQVMANIATGVGNALDNRLTDFANAVLNDNQWEQLADEIRELEQALDQTLAAVDTDLGRIRRYSDGIGESCTDYERQKQIARQALSEGLDLSVTASRLWDRLGAVDTAACQQPEPVPQANDNAAKRASLGSTIEGDRAKLAAEVEKVCALPAEIRNAADKAQARERLDAGLQSAREVEAIAARLTGTADELAGLSKPVAGASGAGNGAASAREKITSEIGALRGEIDTLAGRFAELDGRFTPARDAMNRAQQRIRNLTDPTKEIIERIQTCLRPLAAAPAAEQPRALLAELSQRSTDIGGCRGVVLESWDERDPDPPSSSGYSSSAAWRNRQLALSHSIASLRGKLAEIEAQCPAPAETPAVADTGVGQEGPDPQAVKAGAEEGLSRMRGCVAEAITTYQDAWGKPNVELSEATCSPEQNADIMAKLRQAADDGSEEAKAHLAKIEPIAANVATAHARYDAASQAYAAGDLNGARAGLNEAKSMIDGLGGSPACADLAGKIASGLDKIERLEQALSSARATLARCEPASLSELQREIGSASHPELAALAARAGLMLGAHARYDEARSAFAAGNLASAESGLRQAKAQLQSANGACADLAGRLDDGLSKVERLRDAIAAAEQAVAACDVDAMKRWKAALANVGNPTAGPVKQSLESSEKRCEAAQRDQAIASANQACMTSFGVFALADRESVARGDVTCVCKQGYQWSEDGKSCVRAPDEAELAAARNANCKQQFGSGYYAGKADKNGQYYCLPTKETANAWCRQNNGSGYYAGRVKGDGSFNCNLSEAAARQAALNECRKSYGSRFIRLVKRNGQYYCEYNTGTANNQPRHDTRASAAAAAAGAAIIQGIIGGATGGGRNCHHRPADSTQHCGSN